MTTGIIGTMVFGALTVLLAVLLPFAFGKDDRALTKFCVILSGICMYLMWICVYLSQVNPLVPPEMKEPAPK